MIPGTQNKWERHTNNNAEIPVQVQCYSVGKEPGDRQTVTRKYKLREERREDYC